MSETKANLKKWAAWALDYYKTSWDEFLQDNGNRISSTTCEAQSFFLEFLQDKFTYYFTVDVPNGNGMLQMPIRPSKYKETPSDSDSDQATTSSANSNVKKAKKKNGKHETSESPYHSVSKPAVYNIEGQPGYKVKVIKAVRPSSSTGRKEKTHSRLPTTARKRCACRDCGKKFGHAGSLYLHRKSHAANAGAKSTGVKTNNARVLNKPYKCNNCDKRYTTAGQLARHKRLHSGKNLYKCNQCMKVFTEPSKLKRHLFVHQTDRPCPCDFCDKAFKSEDHLARHQKNRHPLNFY